MTTRRKPLAVARLLTAVLLASCGSPSSNLPTHKHLDAAPAALLVGPLALQGSCLLVTGAGGPWLPIWPPAFHLVGQELQGPSGPVAKVGDLVSLGGGEYHETEWQFLSALMET